MTRAHDGFDGRAREIEQQAAEWVTRIDLRGTPEVWSALDAWLAISPRHRAAFLRLSVAWRRADGLRQLAPLNGEVDVDLLSPARARIAMPSPEDVPEGRVASLEAQGIDVAPELPHQPEVSAPPAVEANDPSGAPAIAPAAHGTRPEPARALRIVASTPNPVAADTNWAAVRQYRASTGSDEGNRGRSRPRIGAAARRESKFLMTRRLAASIAVVGVLGVAGFGGWQYLERTRGEVYSTEVGEFRRVTLSDGSTVGLNTASAVRVRYTDQAREIELLRGEALFEVAKNPQRPFDVEAGNTTVRAVGTAFSVRLHEDDDNGVDVIVSEGRVAINPPSRRTYQAGSVATVRKGTLVSIEDVPPGEIASRHAWTSGRLVFLDETLTDVVAEMNRYNRRKLLIRDPKIASLRIGGTFQATDPETFAKGLRPLGIESRIETRAVGDEVILLNSASR